MGQDQRAPTRPRFTHAEREEKPAPRGLNPRWASDVDSDVENFPGFPESVVGPELMDG